MNKKVSGFTLVEMATVLVIIGLILGMAFKGKDLIDGAKVKSLAAQVTKIQSAVQTYYERYGQYPGDGCNTPSPSTTVCTANPKDGIIVSTESDAAWTQMINLTNIITSNERMSIFGQNWNFWQGTWGPISMTGTWLDLPGGNQIDIRFFCAYDKRFDDGINLTGSARAQNTAGSDYSQSTTDCWNLSTFMDGWIKIF